MFVTELHFKDETIFQVRFKKEIPEASGLRFRGRKFFFRSFKDGKAIFEEIEEGAMVEIFEKEATQIKF
jgi:hypothetical protein